MNVLLHDASWEKGAPMVLMSDWWVRAHWGRAFEIVEIVPQIHNQSWAVMRKRDVEAGEYEHSLSWRLTRPLRAASHRLRAWRTARSR